MKKKFILNIAIKNLLKYKIRTFLTFIILSSGVFFYLIADGLLNGMEKDTINTILKVITPDIKIVSKNNPVEISENIYPIKNFSLIINKLKNFNFVVDYTIRANFAATIEIDNTLFPVRIICIDPENDFKVFTLLSKNKAKKLNLLNTCLIGKELLKTLNLNINKTIKILFKIGKNFKIIPLNVSDTFESFIPEINSTSIIIGFNTYKNLFNIPQPSEIDIKLDKRNNYKEYQKILSKHFKDLKIIPWIEDAADILLISKTKSQYSSILIIFILIIASIGIINTMTLSIYDLSKEIGTLKAIGMNENEIGQIFIYQGIIIGLSGALTGILSGIIVNYFLVKYGLNMGTFGGYDIIKGLNIPMILHSTWNIKSYLIAIILAVLISYLSSFSAAKKAASLDPAKTLRTI